MNLEFGPILRSLKSHKIASFLIALQIAVTMTVLANGLFIIMERTAVVNRDSGYDPTNIIFVTAYVYDDNADTNSHIIEDLERIKRIPSVVAVTPTTSIPYSGAGAWVRIEQPDDDEAQPFAVGYYSVDENGLDAFDLDLVAGTNFTKEDISLPKIADEDRSSLIKHIITTALADRLFPGMPYSDVIGKQVKYESTDDVSILIKGVVRKMHTPWTTSARIEENMLMSQFFDLPRYYYAVRVEPGLVNSTMDLIHEALASSQTGRVIEKIETLSTRHKEAYQEDSGLVNTLLIVITGLSAITIFGIIGLTHFSVSARQKQIGTRRALGASRLDILRYFIMENVLISFCGILLGVGLTIALNVLLVNQFSVEKLDWIYIPISMIIMVGISLFGVLGPAQRAASISPAIATRG